MFRLLRNTFFLFSVLAATSASAQRITGIWRGYFISDDGEQYKLEMQVDNLPTSLAGVTYSYLDTRFYGKATLTGSFNRKTKKALVQEIKTVELRMAAGSVSCIMKYNLDYSQSGKEEFLEGVYSSTYEKTPRSQSPLQGAGCGGGKVFLRKVTESDFYVEPFLREKLTARKPVARSAAKKPAAATTTTAKKPQAPPKTTVAKTPAAKPKERTTTPIQQQPNAGAPVLKAPVASAPARTFKLPVQTRDRQNELIKTLDVEHPTIRVRLYDNGEIDDDTVSVYLNNQLVLSNKRLSTAPLEVTIKLDIDNPVQTLVMVAENLGRIPPNTSLMLVQDGDKRYEVRITSTEQKNAAVQFRYSGGG